MVGVAAHAGALRDTTAAGEATAALRPAVGLAGTLGPAVGLAAALGLNVPLSVGLGAPTAGCSGPVTNRKAPTAITATTVAAAIHLVNAGPRTGVDTAVPNGGRHGERWLNTALKASRR